jgi:hypothetical protein
MEALFPSAELCRFMAVASRDRVASQSFCDEMREIGLSLLS